MTKPNYTFNDACSIADYHDRTGLYPEGMDHAEFMELMTKHNLHNFDFTSFTDPAGGSGLHSHI